MSATMYGCEIVWPPPSGSAASAYASSRSSSGTKSSRGTRAIAASTASSATGRELDRRLAIEAAGQLAGIDLRAGKEVDLARAIRGRDDDLTLQIHEPRLEPRDALDLRLAVVGKEHHRVASEELVRPTR